MAQIFSMPEPHRHEMSIRSHRSGDRGNPAPSSTPIQAHLHILALYATIHAIQGPAPNLRHRLHCKFPKLLQRQAMQLLRPIVVLHLITMIQTACDTVSDRMCVCVQVGPCRDNCGENASCPTANGLPQILATNFPRIPLVFIRSRRSILHMRQNLTGHLLECRSVRAGTWYMQT